MGWFDEQLRKRYAKNQEIFQDSLVDMASSILGSDNADQLKDAKSVAREELEEILDYYHFKTTEIPDSAETLEDQMEYALRPHGLMHRKVTLGEKWLKEAYGPMIAFEKETGKPVITSQNAKQLNGIVTKLLTNSEDLKENKIDS